MASRHQRIGRGKEIVRVSVKGHFGAGAELPAWRALCFNRNKTSKGIWRVIPGRKRKKKKMQFTSYVPCLKVLTRNQQSWMCI